MGKKSSSKNLPQGPAQTPPSAGRATPSWLWIAVVVAVVAVGAMWFLPGSSSPETDAAAASSNGQTGKEAAPDVVAKIEAAAKKGPRKQASLPPIPFQGYEPPRPRDVVTAAYYFAAEHPEILGYVPCFCGCEHAGHSGNADCFVKTRNEDGDVVEWDEHGVECAICIDVATRSRQMHASGASVRDIRAAIDQQFGPTAQTRTATPKPPAHNHNQ